MKLDFDYIIYDKLAKDNSKAKELYKRLLILLKK